MRDMLRTSAGRTVVLIVLALAIAALTGLVLLWPSGTDVKVADVRSGSTVNATVTAIGPAECRSPGATDCVRISARLTTGPKAGDSAELLSGESTSDPTFAIGDRIHLAANEVPPGAEADASVAPYSFVDYERRGPLLWLAVGFGFLVLILGRLRGAMALLGLGASMVLVFAFIVPAMLAGEPPVAVAAVGSAAVMLITIALAHGVNAKSFAAMLGTAGSLAITISLALGFSKLTHLTGLGSDAASFVLVGGEGVSLQGIVIAGMVIGALGVLDDVTVSQASTVMALKRANPAYSTRELYREGLDVGHDHIAATINTLVLAYAGASLPILLVFSIGGFGVSEALNSEAVAEQIVAMLVGSIGLIAAVPITTWIAASVAQRLDSEQLAGTPGHAH